MKPVNAILKLINPTYKKVCKLEENQITKENLSNILSCLFDIHSLRKATGAVRKIQNVNNYLLTELKNICDELNIKYWLRGGTLLGAVRHKGYIP